MFFTCLKISFVFSFTFLLLSANALKLDQSKNLLYCGKVLNNSLKEDKKEEFAFGHVKINLGVKVSNVLKRVKC